MYFLKHKSQVLEKFKEFEADATSESGQRIGTLRTDNGGEYLSREFEAYLQSKGIRHEQTVAYSPQQNGVAEIESHPDGVCQSHDCTWWVAKQLLGRSSFHSSLNNKPDTNNSH